MPVERLSMRARRCIPEPYRRLVGSPCDRLPVWRERDIANLVAMPFERLSTRREDYRVGFRG